MIIPCFRCGKAIDTPESSNADYIIADDTIVREPREVLVALKENQATLFKRKEFIAKNTVTLTSDEQTATFPPSEDVVRSQFLDSEYDNIEVPDVATAQRQFGEDLARVKSEIGEKDIQKTGIICPDCYRDTDFVIWGVHKR